MADSSEQPTFVIGREVGSVGRWVRLGVGLLGIAGIVVLVIRVGPSGPLIGQIATGAGLALVFFLGWFWVLGKRLLAWLNPWMRTVLFRGPLLLAASLPFIPSGLRLGTFLYLFAALFVTALMRYGGCEVVAVPSLLFGQRYPVYCELNALDLVERPLRQTSRRLIRWIGGTLALLVGVYLLLVPFRTFFGLTLPQAPWIAALLLLPALLLLWDAWCTFRVAGGHLTREVRNSLLGIIALVITALLFGLGLPI